MNGQTHGGKGSAQRSVDQEKFNSNWDAIFAPKALPEDEACASPFKDEPWYKDQEDVGDD